jgi:hypothetical protein
MAKNLRGDAQSYLMRKQHLLEVSFFLNGKEFGRK